MEKKGNGSDRSPANFFGQYSNKLAAILSDAHSRFSHSPDNQLSNKYQQVYAGNMPPENLLPSNKSLTHKLQKLDKKSHSLAGNDDEKKMDLRATLSKFIN